MTEDGTSLLWKRTVDAMCWLLAVSLAYVILQIPQDFHLLDEVQSQLNASGVSNPVTAVLLNFRAYDTLLEICVLFLALLGAWAVGPAHVEPHWSKPGAILLALLRELVPLMIVIGIALLWKGAHAPGGAFQAGAIIGAAGVLLLIADTLIPWLPAGWPLRIMLSIGLSVFLITGLSVAGITGGFLHYPVEHAKTLITLIESAATLSIGITLIALFAGGEPSNPIGKIEQSSVSNIQEDES